MNAHEACRLLEEALTRTLTTDQLCELRTALIGARPELSIDAVLRVHVREPLARLGAAPTPSAVSRVGSIAGQTVSAPPSGETDNERLCRELEETNANVRRFSRELADYFARAFTKLPTSRLNALLFLDLVLAQKRHELDTMIRNLTKTEIP